MTNASEGSKQERKQASVYRTTGYILRDREISHRFSFSFLPFFQTERIPSIVITNGTIFASMPANILPFGSENSKASPSGRRRAFRFQLFVFNVRAVGDNESRRSWRERFRNIRTRGNNDARLRLTLS